MNDIDKTNADECLNELFEEDTESTKEEQCECQKDCNEECNCKEECSCQDEQKDNCGCKNGEECSCGDDCTCGESCTCQKENQNDGESEQAEQPNEQDRQPSDTAFETLLRLQAEFDNYRKRTEKEKSEMYHHGFVDAVTDFLPALDSFKMAKEYITDKNTLVGIEYIEKGILQTLEKMGVTTIDATGKFDPNFHTAIDTSSDENYEEGDIVKECYKGFKMGDKVIRFSQVIVKR